LISSVFISCLKLWARFEVRPKIRWVKGGTALQLLKPFTDRNFSLGWVSAASKSANKYFTLVGTALTGAAWALAGAHIFCWKPPEQHLDSYLERLSKTESVTAAALMVRDDIVGLFERIFNHIKGSLFDHNEMLQPLAKDVNSETSWIHTSHNPQVCFDVETFSPQSLHQEGILPREILELKNGSALYSVETLWEGRGSLVSSEPDTGEHKLQKNNNDVPLERSDQDSKSLFNKSDRDQ